MPVIPHRRRQTSRLVAAALLAASLEGCIGWSTVTAAPPGSEAFRPPPAPGRPLPAVIIRFTSFLDKQDHPAADLNRDLFVERLRASGLFASVDTNPALAPPGPRVNLIVEQAEWTMGGVCPLFGCGAFGMAVRWVLVVPAVFSMGAREFRIEAALTVIAPDGTRRTYRAAGREVRYGNSLYATLNPWGPSSFGERVATALFNQAAKEARLFTRPSEP